MMTPASGYSHDDLTKRHVAITQTDLTCVSVIASLMDRWRL